MLDVNFDDIDLSYPRLAKNVYELNINKIERRTTNDNDFLVIGLTTIADASDTEGNPLPAGYKTTTVLGLKPFEGETEADVNKRLAALVRSTGTTGLTKDSFLANVAILQGKTAVARVSTYIAKKDGAERNAFNFFVKK